MAKTRRKESQVAEGLVKGIHYANATYRIGIVVGQCFGGLAFIGGIVLIILGISGRIDWIVEAGSLTSRLLNASPGAIFGVVGFLVLWRYKPIVTDRLSVRLGGESGRAISEILDKNEQPGRRNRSWRSDGDHIDYQGRR